MDDNTPFPVKAIPKNLKIVSLNKKTFRGDLVSKKLISQNSFSLAPPFLEFKEILFLLTQFPLRPCAEAE